MVYYVPSKSRRKRKIDLNMFGDVLALVRNTGNPVTDNIYRKRD